jgi:aldose 1-epimerase
MNDRIASAPYGHLPDGRAVTRFALSNRNGASAEILDYGGILASLRVADRDGRHDNVVLGCADLEGYCADRSYFGALVGRYANRIAHGRFRLDGTSYQLACNDPPNALHGGHQGYNRSLWRAEIRGNAGGPALALHHVSPDGDEGYPGRLTIEVLYAFGADDALRIDYTVTTDRPTVVNLTSHSYFNLAGEGSGDVYGHELMIAADAFTPVDATLIPTGEVRSVAGTPFDFRAAAPIGRNIRAADEQILRGGGFDHNFVLRAADAGALRLAAVVRDPRSGRVMEVSTTEPGVQFYSGNSIDSRRRGSGGRPYRPGDGFCLETQHFPDSPNRDSFPSTALRPGHTLRSTTVYRFGTDR